MVNVKKFKTTENKCKCHTFRLIGEIFYLKYYPNFVFVSELRVVKKIQMQRE